MGERRVDFPIGPLPLDPARTRAPAVPTDGPRPKVVRLDARRAHRDRRRDRRGEDRHLHITSAIPGLDTGLPQWDYAARVLEDRLKASADTATAAPSRAERRGALVCADPMCGSTDAAACAYIDRRQRECPTAWCREHQLVVFGHLYCRRHAGIIRALGPDHTPYALPDLDNRAPSLAYWVARDLDGPVRSLLEEHFGNQRMNVSPVVTGGSPRERTWGRSWKLISENGVDISVNISVPEADDGLVRLSFDGRGLVEMTPPWIEARRRGITLDADTDALSRRRFYALLVEDLDAAMRAARSRPSGWSSPLPH